MLLWIGTLTAQDGVAWALVRPDGQGASWIPNLDYQFIPGGTFVRVDRVGGTSTNRFIVRFPGITDPYGNFQAAPFDGDHAVVINGWSVLGGEVRCQVEIFAADGSPAFDEGFTLFYRLPSDPEDRQAFCWANDPTAVSYTANTNYSWNGNRSNAWINRAATGVYYVYFYGLSRPTGPEQGNIQATPYGTQFRRCWVQSVGHQPGGDVLVLVKTFDAAGNAADTRFTLHYNEQAAPIDEALGSGAHIRSDDGTVTCHVPDARFRDSNGDVGPNDSESILRLTPGRYIARLPDVQPDDSATAIVTAFGGFTPIYASIEGWGDDGCGGTGVQVTTRDAAGNPIDAEFSLLYMTNRPVQKREQAWAWINPFNAGAQFVTSANYSYSTRPVPGVNTAFFVDRVAPTQNRFQVRFTNMAPNRGIPLVSAHSVLAPQSAVIRDWWEDGHDVVVDVEVFDGTGGPADDGMFTALYRRDGSPEHREAYLFAHQPAATGYPPAAWWNGDRGTPQIQRVGTGHYRATLPGLAPLGGEQGHVQVAPVADWLVRANVSSWTPVGGDMRVDIRCYDEGGNATDSKFVLLYNEIAAPVDERAGSGAHLWANQQSSPVTYTPAPAYADSNGRAGPPNAETVTRLATGSYEVILPNQPKFDSVNVQVSTYGSAANFAMLSSFGGGTSGPTTVRVRTFDAGGQPVDSQFNLLYLSDDSALLLADNIPHSSGCNGAVLTGLTKPALCRTWDMCLDVSTPGGVLGFVQLGLSNPNFSFGSQAPLCRQYTDGLVTVIFPMPGFVPTYGMAIPADPSFVGLEIFAQGGALVPGINPLGLAASNGLIGRVGH